MSLVVEDGQGRIDADAYVSVADCDTYHDLLGNTSWTVVESGEAEDVAANLKAREIAIRKATAFVDAKYGNRFKGRRVNYSQALAWPRFEVYDEDGYEVTGVPLVIKKATCEAALRAFMGTELMPDQARGGAVIAESVGSISVTYASGAPAGTTYNIIDALVRPVLGASTVTMVRA